MISGFSASLFALLFMHAKESQALGISQFIFGKPVLFDKMPWPVLDPMVISLPVSILVIVVLTLTSNENKKVLA
jgi:SSS family solute:Na+ symporter